MFKQRNAFVCVWVVILVFAVAGWAQHTPNDDSYPLTSAGSTSHDGNSMLDLQNAPQTAQRPSGATGNGSNHPNANDPAPSFAVSDAAVPDNVTGHDSAPGAIQIEVSKVGGDLSPVDSKLPPTMTVKTATLLELHEMRQSAVDLCVQLPTKYRTRLPQCAAIFKHEIRLEALAKHNQ